MATYFPSLDECNDAIDWIEEWAESQSSLFPMTAVKLKIRIKEWDEFPGQLFLFLTWHGYEPPNDSDVIAPPGWYMYHWCREEENGQTVWCNTLNKSK